MVAQGLVEAAGLRGRQNWALILSSSARVSKVTYETVIAVRYPELDADTPTHVTFGNCLADQQATVGGFLPIFWRSPPLDMKSIIGAATVVGCLQHGAGVCDEQFTGSPLSPLLVELKARSLARSREDDDFLTALRHSATIRTGEFPPAALVEIYHEPGAVAARLRRLHLIIVDLCHPRKTVTKIEKQFHDKQLLYATLGQLAPRPYPFGAMKLGGVVICLAIVWMTLTNLSS